LMDRFDQECKKLGLVIQSITVGQLEPSKELAELADQISERERARITREKNAELIAQYKQDQDRRAKEVLAEQKRALVDATSKREVEEGGAKQLKEVEESKLEQELKSAGARLEAAKAQAKAVLTKGKAEATVILAHNKAEVAGLRTAVAGFGNPDAFAQ